MDLDHKTIVIIGGTTGLGLAAAKACAQAGASVVITGRDRGRIDTALAEIGPRSQGMPGDAAVAGAAEEAIAFALKTFGGFDGLYHVAGGSGRRFGDGPLHEITDEGWRMTMQWNLDSIFFSNRAAVRSFLERRVPGSVLNMGSVLGFAPSPGFFTTHAYATAKAAIIGLTRSAAARYARDNVRFNVIAPALVETPMSTRARQNEAIMRFIKTKQPLDGGRIGSAEDAAEAAVFFLSDASRFITGQVLSVDGGWQLSDGQLGGEELT